MLVSKSQSHWILLTTVRMPVRLLPKLLRGAYKIWVMKESRENTINEDTQTKTIDSMARRSPRRGKPLYTMEMASAVSNRPHARQSGRSLTCTHQPVEEGVSINISHLETGVRETKWLINSATVNSTSFQYY